MNGTYEGWRPTGQGFPGLAGATGMTHPQPASLESIVRDGMSPCPLLDHHNDAEQILKLAVQGNRLNLSGLLRSQMIWVLSTERLWQHWRSQPETSWPDGSVITIELPPMTQALHNRLDSMKSRLEAELQLQINFESRDDVDASPRHAFSRVPVRDPDVETANAKQRQSRLLAAIEQLVAQPQMDAGVKGALDALIEAIRCEEPRGADLWRGLRRRVAKIQDDGFRGLLLEKVESCVMSDKALEPGDIRRFRGKLAGDGSWDIDTLRRLRSGHPLPSPPSGKAVGSLQEWCQGLAGTSVEGGKFDDFLSDWQSQWKKARAEADDEEGWRFKCQWASHVQTLAGWAADAADVKVLSAWIVEMVDVLTRAGYFRLVVALVEASLDEKFLSHIPRRRAKAFVEGMGRLLFACFESADKARRHSAERLSAEAVASATKKINVAFRHAGVGLTWCAPSKKEGPSITLTVPRNVPSMRALPMSKDEWCSAVEEAVRKGQMPEAWKLAQSACDAHPDLEEIVGALLSAQEPLDA